MAKLSEIFKSKHKTKLPDPKEPTPFQLYGGFGPAAEAAGSLDDETERSARREGLSVAAELERQRIERQREARKAEPLPQGHDFSKGLG